MWWSLVEIMSDQIEIRVYLHSSLVQFSPDGMSKKFSIKLPVESTIRELIALLEITLPLDGLLIGLNDEVADENTILRSGDSVHIMMPISGG